MIFSSIEYIKTCRSPTITTRGRIIFLMKVIMILRIFILFTTEPILIVSVFFQSIIKRYKRVGNRFSIFRFIINVIYGFIISCITGSLISLVLYMYAESRLNLELSNPYLLWIPIPSILLLK